MFVFAWIVDDKVDQFEIKFGPVATLVLAAVIFLVGVAFGAFIF